MCTYTTTVFACEHPADVVFLSQPCEYVEAGLECPGYEDHVCLLKYWKCTACDGLSEAVQDIADDCLVEVAADRRNT